MSRSKAYRWGEDGIAGICDRYQLLCFAPSLWNENDPHLKERFFGLTPFEGNHGEDVKEYYFHVDNTWSWGPQQLPQPRIRTVIGPSGTLCLEADDNGMFLAPKIPDGCRLGRRWLITAADSATVLATDNETNGPVVYGAGSASRSPFTKDAFHRFLYGGERAAVNPAVGGKGLHPPSLAGAPRRLCRDASGAHRPATGRGRAADHRVRIDR